MKSEQQKEKEKETDQKNRKGRGKAETDDSVDGAPSAHQAARTQCGTMRTSNQN